MNRVTGIGGIFIKARDPEALKSWYREHLGLDVQSWGGGGDRLERHAGDLGLLFAEHGSLHGELPGGRPCRPGGRACRRDAGSEPEHGGEARPVAYLLFLS